MKPFPTPDFTAVETPCYLCEEARLEANLRLLQRIEEESGARILLALKGFALWGTFPLVRRYLSGCAASGLHEARLGREEMGKEVHTYSPAFKESDLAQIAAISDHIVFNTPQQVRRFAALARAVNPAIECSLRLNPEVSVAPVDLYDPSAPGSRLGTTLAQFDPVIVDELDGFHFHLLCEQDSYALETVLNPFLHKFGHYLPRLKSLNLGGGHHITREGYDVDHLIHLLRDLRQRYPQLTVYLEPGEAIGWQTGTLVATVLEIMHNGIDIAILDCSAEAHMPDTLAMPYRAEVRGAGKCGEKPYCYRLSGNTCLAGDVMGDYSFEQPLEVGDRIIFEDQIHYTMVKNSTFNGIKLPNLALFRSRGEIQLLREFGYEEYRRRLS
ncbi:MAG: carboxynorspermidine decarboxylase [Gammaproteobacteria bacterium]|nr:carboxynorspermidine decarboxylase [Gammaproteobacteria bacterium]